MKSSITDPRQWPTRVGLRSTVLATVLGLFALGITSVPAAPKPNPNIAPINSKPHGKSYSQWAAAWWQWAYSIPADENPITDTTGENADEGQDGNVWFLAGNNGGTSEREVFVPEGKSLFFPIMNQSWVQFPSDPPHTIPELRAILRPGLDNAVLHCEIDGRAVQNLAGYRVESAVFTTTVPDGNLLELPAGDYAPCVDDGYYLMVNPLKKGQHAIHFTAESADHSFKLDVSYIVNVGKPAQIVAPDKRYRGKTYGGWAAAWWQWALSFPEAQNPVADTTGAFAGVGQSGPVWFVAGTFGNSVERTFSVPAGKSLFMPVHSWILGSGVFDCDPTVPGVTCDVPTLRANAAANVTGAAVVEAWIDGVPVNNIRDYRAISPEPFSITVPAGAVFGIPAGTYSPQVADGYWLMLPRFSKGNHTIQMHVVNSAFDTDYTHLLHLRVQ